MNSMALSSIYRNAINRPDEVLTEEELAKRDEAKEADIQWKHWARLDVTKKFLAELEARKNSALDRAVLRKHEHNKAIESLSEAQQLAKVITYAITGKYTD